jgi:hypothetical protein
MIHKITNTKALHDIYFEDIDDVVSSKKECYLINPWVFFYFSTLKAAKVKAKKLGISEEVVNQNGRK